MLTCNGDSKAANGVDAIAVRSMEMGDLTTPPTTTPTHCHPPSSLSRDRQAQKLLAIASVLSFCFILVEMTGGWIANSLAIMTDAAHMLSDFGSFLLSLFAIWLSGRPATVRMTFGYHRAEVLGAVGSILAIWVLTGVLVGLAIERLLHPAHHIDADVMLATAVCGIAFNLLLGAVLHWGGGGHGHTHGAGHSHGQRNMNVRAAFIHVLGDLVQSVGVLLAAVVIKLWPSMNVVDPICTFFFSVVVLTTTIAVMRDAVRILMQGTPKHVEFVAVENALLSIGGVVAVHSLHIWSVTMDKAALSCHLAIDSTSSALETLESANALLRLKYDLAFTTIQVEEFRRDIMRSCHRCVEPRRNGVQAPPMDLSSETLDDDSETYGTFYKDDQAIVN